MGLYRLLEANLNVVMCVSFTLFCMVPTVACGIIYDFEEGVGSGWNSDGNVHWHRDSSVSHNGSYSLKSGDIECIGTSSIYVYLKGPGEITFWWKKGGGSAKTDFTFSVDGIVQRTCRSYEWENFSYTIFDPDINKLHIIKWDFKKEACYLQGNGWIDDVEINGEIQRISETKETLPVLEYGDFDIKLRELDYQISKINNNISCLESNTYDLTSRIYDLNTDMSSLKNATSYYLEAKVYPQTCFDISNLDVITITNREGVNLAEEINKYKNKLVYLEGGNYKTGHIDIVTSNIIVRPIAGSIVTLDGMSDICTLSLSNNSNVSVEGLNIINSTEYGIQLDGCKDCCILYNNIYNYGCNGSNYDDGIGIGVFNSENIYIGWNSIASDYENARGIALIDHTKKTKVENNAIRIKGYHIYLSDSCDNFIKIDSSDSFKEKQSDTHSSFCGDHLKYKCPCETNNTYETHEDNLNVESCNIWEIT